MLKTAGICLVLAACSGEQSSPEQSSGEQSSPEQPPEESSPESSPVVEAETQTLRLGDLSVVVPSNWRPSPEPQMEHLRQASTRRDPGADVHVIGVSAPTSPGVPSLTLLTLLQTEPYSSQMHSVEQAYQQMRTGMEAGATLRNTTVTLDGSCDATSCSLLFQIGSTGGRVRLWRVEGRMMSSGCTCAGPEGCGLLEACHLPAVPADAESVTAGPPSN